MIVLAVSLVFAGCMSLALSQERTWKAVGGGLPAAGTRTAIRTAGWILLAAALGVCIAAEGPGFAVLVWMLLIALASFVVAMTLGFRPGLLPDRAQRGD